MDYPECKRHKSTEDCLSNMGFQKPKSISIGPKKWRQLLHGKFAQEKPLLRDACSPGGY
jgi:hypothetical protein